MKNVAKYLASVIVLVIGLFFVIVNFSEGEARFQCSGEISADGNTKPATVFMRLSKYRWWVGLWSDSDGSVVLEIPNRSYESYPYVKQVGDQLQIFRDIPDLTLKGNFSELSKALALDTSIGFFDGICTAAE